MPRQGRVTRPKGIARYPRACVPPWWARGGHAQTIAAHMLPSRARSMRERDDVRRHEIVLADGDRLVALATPGSSGVRVHLFHGLSGDVDSDYVRRAAESAGARGHSVWAVNHRGCGDGRGLARKPYHSGRSDDLRAVLEASCDEAPEFLRVVIGFSMSGNIALLHAAEPNSLADAVIAVNPVVDLANASKRISQGFSRLYELRFVNRLRADLRDRQRLGLIETKLQVASTSTLRNFDDRITAPLGGFRDADDYYEKCSSLGRLANVARPTVVIAAADDPFLDAKLFATAPLSSSIFLHIEEHGGHIGFLGRKFERWIDGALEHYLDELLRELRSTERSV